MNPRQSRGRCLAARSADTEIGANGAMELSIEETAKVPYDDATNHHA